MRNETSPEDVGGMHAAAGILTARGGMTSHAAVVARGWGKCCVSGCSEIRVNETNKVSSSVGLVSLFLFSIWVSIMRLSHFLIQVGYGNLMVFVFLISFRSIYYARTFIPR